MLKGLPASGKSTLARELVDSGNYIRVNRDDLRAMLHNGKWSGKNEDMIVAVEVAIAMDGLAKDKNVVIDDCNLNPKNENMWRAYAKGAGASFEVREIKTSVEDCIKRDITRNEKRVGRDVIVGMALQWNLFPRPDKGFVLCDLDGTLCDITHRLKYANGPEKDWKKFFEGIPDDTIHINTLELLNKYTEEGHRVIFISARPDTYRKETKEWLAKEYSQNYETLIMRRSNDKREDSIIKQEIYDRYFRDKYDVHCVIDDRPRVIRMWRANGLEVIDVGNGEEF